MLTRVDTLKRNGTQQNSCLHNFGERLERLEEMQASTLQLLNVLVRNLQTTSRSQQTVPLPQQSKLSERLNKDIDDDEDDDVLNFTSVSTPDDVTLPVTSLLSSSTSRKLLSSSFSNRKGSTNVSAAGSATSQMMVNAYGERMGSKNVLVTALSANEDHLTITTNPMRASSSSLDISDENAHQNLSQAEETEHNIYGKLIKERFRKLSEVVEDIERTLPSHQQRHDSKHDKCDIIDDDETLSTLDWVDTTCQVMYSSERASRFDPHREENVGIGMSSV
jgi:hypothetical protein